jgi:hypothetical protein
MADGQTGGETTEQRKSEGKKKEEKGIKRRRVE